VKALHAGGLLSVSTGSTVNHERPGVSQDRIEIKKDGMLGEIEARIKQQVGEETLFTIQWRLE